MAGQHGGASASRLRQTAFSFGGSSIDAALGRHTANCAAALKAIEEIRTSGVVPARGIARELTARRVPTSTGSSIWAAAQVQRILRAA